VGFKLFFEVESGFLRFWWLGDFWSWFGCFFWLLLLSLFLKHFFDGVFCAFFGVTFSTHKFFYLPWDDIPVGLYCECDLIECG